MAECRRSGEGRGEGSGEERGRAAGGTSPPPLLRLDVLNAYTNKRVTSRNPYFLTLKACKTDGARVF